MIPTLEIVHPDLPGAKMIINEADFDPSRHQRYGEPKGRKRSPEQTPDPPEDLSPEPISDLSQTQSPEQTPNLSEDQPASAPDLSQEQSPEQTPDLPEAQSPEQTFDEPQEQSPEPTPDLPEALSPEQTPKGPEDSPPEPTLSEAQPPTYTQSDLETKNITALRAIAAQKRIPRRMKLSRDELIEAILGGNRG